MWAAVNWSPAISNYPALLSNSNINFWLGNQGPAKTTVNEAECNVNLNPPGTPFEGQTNTTKTDVYETLMRGIVYSTADVNMSYHPVLEGVVIAHNNINSTATDVNPVTLLGGRTYLDVTYLSHFYKSAPPGFRASPIFKLAPVVFARWSIS